MKTVVFHSYKGGVGRSLALSNLAFALSAMKKRVVVMDLDIDAPGLHSKLALSSKAMDGWEDRVKGGYIDYLAYYFGVPEIANRNGPDAIVNHNPSAADLHFRCEYLNKSCVIEVNDFLKFVPAGKYDQKYWWNLASPWFNELFSISRNEYSSYGTVRLHQKREFLRHEKDVIQSLFKERTDYFLVDCKSAREYSSVPLYYWADIIVSMFPVNQEGIQGAARIHQFVWSVRKDDLIRIIPVACRLPGDVDFSTVKTAYYECLERLLEQYRPAYQPVNPIVDKSNFVRLREHRLLEHSERILTTGLSTNREKQWYHALLLDYIDLFSQIFDDNDTTQSQEADNLRLNSKDNWMTILKMGKQRSIDDGSFHIKPDHGIVENKDSQRNVLLRASTLRILIDNIAGATTDEELRKKTLVTVGRRIGLSFGKQFAKTNQFFEKSDSLEKKLHIWCAYDSQNAGFGVLIPSFQPEKLAIVWKDNFFEDDGETEQEDNGGTEHEDNGGTGQRKEGEFGYLLALGYIEGVIGQLAGLQNESVSDEEWLEGFSLGPVNIARGKPNSVEFSFKLTGQSSLFVLTPAEQPNPSAQ